MIDISQTVAPKSDQLNADDLIGGPRTIKVTRVSKMSEPDQPIAIYFEGDGGKPYKPGKSMRRVMLRVWGADAAVYAGRRMTLYRDDAVQFGGIAVGGIRISHMSGISAPITMALTATKARRVPYTVKPLGEERQTDPSQPQGGSDTREPAQPKKTKADLFADARAEAAKGSFALAEWRASFNERIRQTLDEIADELAVIAEKADALADEEVI